MKKSSESSRRGRRRLPSDKLMKTNTKEREHEIAALKKLRDEDVDTTDIPEMKDSSKAVVGKFYRPIKEPITIRLDADVIAWLKSGGPGYQTRINALLRRTMGPEQSSEHARPRSRRK